MKMRKPILFISVFMASASLQMPLACSSPAGEEVSAEKILVEVGDSALTVREVVSRIPSGLSEQDSLDLFNSIVERWVRTMMLSDLASDNIADLEKIDRMAESAQSRHSSLKYSYCDAWRRPYFSILSIAEDVGEDIHFLMSPKRSSESATLIYIPLMIGAESLGSARDFETSYGGSTYILHVFDYLPTGSVMPYEYASRCIADMMEREKKADYRIRLLTSLYSKSIEEGRLKPGLYDPVKRKMRQEVASDNENKNKKRT